MTGTIGELVGQIHDRLSAVKEGSVGLAKDLRTSASARQPIEKATVQPETSGVQDEVSGVIDASTVYDLSPKETNQDLRDLPGVKSSQQRKEGVVSGPSGGEVFTWVVDDRSEGAIAQGGPASEGPSTLGEDLVSAEVVTRTNRPCPICEEYEATELYHGRETRVSRLVCPRCLEELKS